MNSPVFTYPFTTRNLTLRGVYDIGGVRVDVIDVTGFYVCGMSYPYTPFSFSAMGASVDIVRLLFARIFVQGMKNILIIMYRIEHYLRMNLIYRDFPLQGVCEMGNYYRKYSMMMTGKGRGNKLYLYRR